MSWIGTSPIGLRKQAEQIKAVMQAVDGRVPRWTSPTSSDQSGFTVTELLIVLALIGILSAISVPALRGFAASRRLKASAHTIRSLLGFARDMAITDRAAYLVVFDLDNARCWLASSETFDPTNPVSSILTTQNTTVATTGLQNAAPGNTQTMPSGQQGTLTPTSGILGVPYLMDRGITLITMVKHQNGGTFETDSGVGYVYFSPNSTAEEALVYLQNSRNQIMSVSTEAASGRASLRQLTAEEVATLGATVED